jgi:hypothetical protein
VAELLRHFEITRFFLPLAIQAASQSLTYPLVAMVASRGPGGPVNLAGLAQANTVMFMLGVFGMSLVTTGMVYAGTKEGFRKFFSVSIRIGLAASLLQGMLCIPPVSRILFGGILGLPPAIETPARIALTASIPLQMLFFLRIPYQVAMYNGKAAVKASLATLGRIAATAALSFLLATLERVGPVWAIFCLTIPVALEALISRLLAIPSLRSLPSPPEAAPSRKEIFLFNLPLSMGGLFLAASGIILGAFMARAPEPERMLPVFYLAFGLANTVAFSATRLQAVVLAFPTREGDERLTFRFALAAGSILGILPLLFLLPGLSELYYMRLQNLPAGDMPLVRMAAACLVFFPFSVALRAHSEGIAAWRRKPLAVLAGQAVFLGVILLFACILLAVEAPAYLIGPACLALANLASSGTIRILLSRETGKTRPIPKTTTSHAQV